MDVEWFLEQAGELLAIPSTADRPAELARALGFVLDFVGPGYTVERFESGGKPSALVYQGEPGQGGSGGGRGGRAGAEPGAGPAGRPDFRVILNAHLDVVPAPPDQFRARREGAGCTRGARRT